MRLWARAASVRPTLLKFPQYHLSTHLSTRFTAKGTSEIVPQGNEVKLRVPLAKARTILSCSGGFQTQNFYNYKELQTGIGPSFQRVVSNLLCH